MRKEPLFPEDVRSVEPQEAQEDVDLSGWEHCPGWKVVDDDDTIHMICFLYEISPGRIVAFTIFSRHMTPEALKFTAREYRAWLYGWGEFRRCEAYVLEGRGHELQWCRRVLGMTLEGKLRAFDEDGRACYIFAVVKE